MKTYKSNISTYRLVKEPTDILKAKINSPTSSVKYCRNFYSDDIEVYESFFVLLLNRANNTIGYKKISQGGTTGTVVDMALLIKYISDSLACGCIIIHNHPSENKYPSNEDTKLTKNIKELLKLLHITLLDHIILTKDNYYSFKEEGIL